MSTHPSLSRSPAAAAQPLEDENLLSEILLRLPPEPSSLPRASAVCNRWRHLVSNPRFIRRFRRHHRRNPPLIGFFSSYGGLSFVPSLEAPNRVASGRFSLPWDHGHRLHLRSLGSRHGLVLMLDPKRRQALVWDPVAGDQHRIALPPEFDAYKIVSNGAVLRAAGDVHFQVVLVVDDKLQRRVLGCVYSSETGLWGNLISPPLPSANLLTSMPAVLVGDSLYWTFTGDFTGILEFNRETQSLAVIPLPLDLQYEHKHQLTVMRAEGGGLGFFIVHEEELIAQLWKRKTDSDGVASWELGKTIELDKLLSLKSLEERRDLTIVGFAECNNVVFLWTFIGTFMVHLQSLQFKLVPGDKLFSHCQPFESVYAAGT